MLIPQLTLETFVRLSEQTIDIKQILSMTDELVQDQKKDHELIIVLFCSGISNPEMLRGFLVAYHCIKEELKKAELTELETLTKTL